jgi:hypothetical protein
MNKLQLLGFPPCSLWNMCLTFEKIWDSYILPFVLPPCSLAVTRIFPYDFGSISFLGSLASLDHFAWPNNKRPLLLNPCAVYHYILYPSHVIPKSEFCDFLKKLLFVSWILLVSVLKSCLYCISTSVSYKIWKILFEIFHNLPQPLQAIAGIVPQMCHIQFLTLPLQFIIQLIILPINCGCATAYLYLFCQDTYKFKMDFKSYLRGKSDPIRYTCDKKMIQVYHFSFLKCRLKKTWQLNKWTIS